MMLMTLMLILWHYSFWGWPVQFLHQTSLHPLKDKEEDCVLLKKLNQLKKGSKITWTIAMEKIPSNYLNYSWVTSPRSRCQTNLPKGQTQVLIIFFFNWVCQVCQAQGMIMKDGDDFCTSFSPSPMMTFHKIFSTWAPSPFPPVFPQSGQPWQPSTLLRTWAKLFIIIRYYHTYDHNYIS